MHEAIDSLKISLWSAETAAAHAALGEAYRQAKDPDAARAEAGRALALDPASAEAEAACSMAATSKPCTTGRRAKITLVVAQQIQDDGFHEIQLNGKQLVFLFMAATVVSVVIFLCGVLVGRGVQAERSASLENTTGQRASAERHRRSRRRRRRRPQPGRIRRRRRRRRASDELSYFNRLREVERRARTAEAG